MSKQSATVLQTSVYKAGGNFTRDLFLFLEQLEYEPNELRKELINECLKKRGVNITYFDYLFTYCNENNLIDVRTRSSGTLSVKINQDGIKELRELRERKLLRQQVVLAQKQHITNVFIALATVIIALSEVQKVVSNKQLITIIILVLASFSIPTFFYYLITKKLPYDL